MADKKRPKVKTVNRIKKRGTKVPNKVTAKQAARTLRKHNVELLTVKL